MQDDPMDNNVGHHSKMSIIRQSAKKLPLPGHKEQVSQAKKGFQKIECQLISEIQYVSERTQKIEFYIREMKQKIKKHLINFKCSPNSFIQET